MPVPFRRRATTAPTAPVAPAVFYLDLPVRDLDAARRFYVDALGCVLGGQVDDAVELWFYGSRITLHHRPSEVLPAVVRGVRRFGVALPRDQWAAAVERCRTQGVALAESGGVVTMEDPSANVVELAVNEPG